MIKNGEKTIAQTGLRVNSLPQIFKDRTLAQMYPLTQRR